MHVIVIIKISYIYIYIYIYIILIKNGVTKKKPFWLEHVNYKYNGIFNGGEKI